MDGTRIIAEATVLQTCSFSLHKMLVDGLVMWITCGLLWCFDQLFGLILTAPIHCRGPIGMQESKLILHFSKSFLIKKQTYLHLEWSESKDVFRTFCRELLFLCHCACCLFRFTEDGCPHKKFFHTRYLMRMRLTPDCSKMLISTSSGYLLILHDLDLTQSLEVGSYRILRARRAPLSTGTCIKQKQRYRWIRNDEYCVLKSWKCICIQRVKLEQHSKIVS